jgi:uncharacterized iron-regulated membrane protein
VRLVLRRIWLRLHRWTALGLGWLLVLTALLGAALVAAPPLDHRAHPELFHARSATRAAAPLEPVRQRLLAEFGPASGLTLRPPRETDDTLWVRVRGSWNGTVYIDPASGLEQGRRGEHEGAYNLLFELHSQLLMGDAGKALLASVALAYTLLLLTGLALWWPRRWPPSLRVEFRKGGLRAFFDLHRTGGALLGLLILVSVLSGAYMAWPPLRAWVSQIAGQAPVPVPKVSAADAGPAATLDVMVARAREAFPDAPIGYIHLPAQSARPVQVRFRLADDPHPNGLSSVWLHPVTGQVLAARRWSALDPGARAVSVIYPLHTGALGGPLHALLTAVTGLALATLGGSGLWLWWRRRH